jgi:hypothetical protein
MAPAGSPGRQKRAIASGPSSQPSNPSIYCHQSRRPGRQLKMTPAEIITEARELSLADLEHVVATLGFELQDLELRRCDQ